jgi:hypothetical protein
VPKILGVLSDGVHNTAKQAAAGGKSLGNCEFLIYSSFNNAIVI